MIQWQILHCSNTGYFWPLLSSDNSSNNALIFAVSIKLVALLFLSPKRKRKKFPLNTFWHFPCKELSPPTADWLGALCPHFATRRSRRDRTWVETWGIYSQNNSRAAADHSLIACKKTIPENIKPEKQWNIARALACKSFEGGSALWKINKKNSWNLSIQLALVLCAWAKNCTMRKNMTRWFRSRLYCLTVILFIKPPHEPQNSHA